MSAFNTDPADDKTDLTFEIKNDLVRRMALRVAQRNDRFLMDMVKTLGTTISQLVGRVEIKNGPWEGLECTTKFYLDGFLYAEIKHCFLSRG